MGFQNFENQLLFQQKKFRSMQIIDFKKEIFFYFIQGYHMTTLSNLTEEIPT